MGLPGKHGQQGIMRNQGAKGEKGEKGKPLQKAIMKSKNMLATGRISCDDHRNCSFAHIFFYNAFIQPSVRFLFLALTFIGSLAHSIVPLLFLQLFGWMVGWFLSSLPTAAEPAVRMPVNTVLSYCNDRTKRKTMLKLIWPLVIITLRIQA